MPSMEYRYLGDRLTEDRGFLCAAVRNKHGKCIRGRNGNMLVVKANGERVVVLARLLRKLKPTDNELVDNIAIAQAIGWRVEQRTERGKLWYACLTPEGILLSETMRPRTLEDAWRGIPDFTRFQGGTATEKAESFRAWQREYRARWPEGFDMATWLRTGSKGKRGNVVRLETDNEGSEAA